MASCRARRRTRGSVSGGGGGAPPRPLETSPRVAAVPVPRERKLETLLRGGGSRGSFEDGRLHPSAGEFGEKWHGLGQFRQARRPGAAQPAIRGPGAGHGRNRPGRNRRSVDGTQDSYVGGLPPPSSHFHAYGAQARL